MRSRHRTAGRGWVWRFLAGAVACGPLAAPEGVRAADLVNGQRLYHAGACYACHRPEASDPVFAARLPVGGRLLATPFGSLDPGNLTPDPRTGLGGWSEDDFLRAMTRGLSPRGRRYLPAFPYRAYSRMTREDLRDLWAYLKKLPAEPRERRAGTLRHERWLRAGTRLWLALAGWPGRIPQDPSKGTAWNRGAYLVLGPGHCGECHTPRRKLWLPEEKRFLAGGPHPAQRGETVPSLRDLSGRGRYSGVEDLVDALALGDTAGYDRLSAGGMGAIQEELAHLPAEDLQAIATYLMSLEPPPPPPARAPAKRR